MTYYRILNERREALFRKGRPLPPFRKTLPENPLSSGTGKETMFYANY